MGSFSRKRIVIIGGTSGIGRAGALKLAGQGAEVFVTGRNDPNLAGHPLPPEVRFIRNDASDPETGRQLQEALPPGASIDGLWLNAGFADVAAVDEIDAAFFDRMMAANVRGPVLHLAALSSRLSKGSSVVVTSSTATYVGAAMAGVYAATKGALISLSRCWASALAERGIRVNALVPGAIDTSFRDFMPDEFRSTFEDDVAGRTALRRIGTPDEAAAVALFLLSDEAGYVTGSQYVVDGGLTMR